MGCRVAKRYAVPEVVAYQRKDSVEGQTQAGSAFAGGKDCYQSIEMTRQVDRRGWCCWSLEKQRRHTAAGLTVQEVSELVTGDLAVAVIESHILRLCLGTVDSKAACQKVVVQGLQPAVEVLLIATGLC